MSFRRFWKIPLAQTKEIICVQDDVLPYTTRSARVYGSPYTKRPLLLERYQIVMKGEEYIEPLWFMAVGEGFEPSNPFWGLRDFESRAFDHSAIPPGKVYHETALC